MNDAKSSDLGDRLAAAGVAAFVSVPTVFIGWLITVPIGAEFHRVPSIHWAYAAWGVLVISAFLVPYLIDVAFGRTWTWMLKIIEAAAQISW